MRALASACGLGSPGTRQLVRRSHRHVGPRLRHTIIAKLAPRLSAEEIRSVIALAWDALPPFADVMTRHGISPGQVVALMRRELTPNAFKIWSARTRRGPGQRPSAPRRR
jgi:uncharacterized protein (TIGR03643 family)